VPRRPSGRFGLAAGVCGARVAVGNTTGHGCHKGLASSEAIRLQLRLSRPHIYQEVRCSFGCRRAVATLSLAERPATSLGMRIRILVLVRRRPGGTRPFRIKDEGLCQTLAHRPGNRKVARMWDRFTGLPAGISRSGSSCALQKQGNASPYCVVGLRRREFRRAAIRALSF
jgi:hypothetical protein